MEAKDLIDWYRQAYSSDNMNVEAMRQKAAYLDGFADAVGGNEEIKNAAGLLRGAAHFIETTRRKSEQANSRSSGNAAT